jgi:hypothetical protein
MEASNIGIKKRHRTWTKKRVGIVIAVAIAYGSWFNFLDSAAL